MTALLTSATPGHVPDKSALTPAPTLFATEEGTPTTSESRTMIPVNNFSDSSDDDLRLSDLAKKKKKGASVNASR